MKPGYDIVVSTNIYIYVHAMIGVARINAKCCVPKQDDNMLALLSNSSQLCHI